MNNNAAKENFDFVAKFYSIGGNSVAYTLPWLLKTIHLELA